LALAIVVQSAGIRLSVAEARLLRFRMAAITQHLQVSAAQLTFALVILRRVYVADPDAFLSHVAGASPSSNGSSNGSSSGGGDGGGDQGRVHQCLVLLFTAIGVARKCLHDTSRRRCGQWSRHVGHCLAVTPAALAATEVNLLFAVQFRLHVPTATFDAWVDFLETKVVQLETARECANRSNLNNSNSRHRVTPVQAQVTAAVAAALTDAVARANVGRPSAASPSDHPYAQSTYAALVTLARVHVD
jgi:hypothetical protein